MGLNYDLAFKTLKTASSLNSYGSNGLPVTPNSVLIIGIFKDEIEKVNNPFLVKYVDCFRCKNDTVIFIHEYFNYKLEDINVDKLFYSLLNGLDYLHNKLNIVHGFICPEIIFKNKDFYKINDWVYDKVTKHGKLLDCKIFFPNNFQFLSPEKMLDINKEPFKISDVWCLALTILYLIDDTIKLPKNPADFLICKTSKEVLKILSPKKIPEKYQKFFEHALEPLAKNRYTIKQLLDLLNENQVFKDIKYIEDVNLEPEYDHLKGLTVNEFYYFWKLTQGNLQKIVSDNKDLSVLNFPKMMKKDGSSKIDTLSKEDVQLFRKLSVSSESAYKSLNEIDEHTIFLPLEYNLIPLKNLLNRLNSLDKRFFYPIVTVKNILPKQFESYISNKASSLSYTEETNLPLVIKETDFEYQLKRTLLFKRLINELPFTKTFLKEEAEKDIPPLYRAKTWASLLNVSSEDIYLYKLILKETGLETDRQINVDIPRCHQYDELLSSENGHKKLKNLLKAWLSHNENEYVYWQGLDSLAAPFVSLNFDNEKLAFASFNSFINKYLEGFFCKDNTDVIQEYLALFSHLIAFHDPALFNHLKELNFTPELYAIPWFLTMFTHVLPLYKIVHVWDTLLLHDKSFPLFIGFSILKQLRKQLIGYPFNDCILIFSDLPEINIETCLKNSKFYFSRTPKCLTQRNLVSLNDIKNESCARIEICELIKILTNDNDVLIVDGRDNEEKMNLGKIKNSIQLKVDQDFFLIDRIRQQNYDFIVVVGSYELAKCLVDKNVVRVCTLLNSTLPPDFYE